jgi:hypothetical protein
LRVVDWVVLKVAAGVASDLVNPDGNLFWRVFRRSWAERAFRATRAAAIVVTATNGRRSGEGW